MVQVIIIIIVLCVCVKRTPPNSQRYDRSVVGDAWRAYRSGTRWRRHCVAHCRYEMRWRVTLIFINVTLLLSLFVVGAARRGSVGKICFFSKLCCSILKPRQNNVSDRQDIVGERRRSDAAQSRRSTGVRARRRQPTQPGTPLLLCITLQFECFVC